MESLPGDGKTHPTHIRTNKFTAPFQGIVNTYGTPRYQEINPGFFAVAMFPFLFGVMFGDIVHGAMLLLFSTYLIIMEDRLGNQDNGEIFSMVYGARYLLFIMSICATYMGFIYNESLSIAIDLFGESAYRSGEHFPEHPYIFGVDSVWRHSGNMISYTNSLKMKMSIILGVGQMMFGIWLKLFNNIYFSRYVEALVESVPEILFMGLTFGYMSILIFIKWSINYPEHPDCLASGCEGVIEAGYPLKAAPPSIIMLMINMFKLQPVEPRHALYPGMEAFQNQMLAVAVLSLPVLLCGKPLYIKRQMDAEAAEKENSGYDAVQDEEAHPHDKHHEHDADDEHNFGDVVVHQGIHTVEFALGCVSNTASYLRLWARALAPSQLSEVIWEYIRMGYEFSLFGHSPGIAGGAKAIIFCYPVFFMCTFGILLGMESLSAFLHALRLQWVEFQSKFYAADGIMFTPLTFDTEVDDE
jgi:V-type H+-transporting ATPase subunit a